MCSPPHYRSGNSLLRVSVNHARIRQQAFKQLVLAKHGYAS